MRFTLIPTTRAPTSRLTTDVDGLEGHGITFTLGRGTELCVAVIETLEAVRRRQNAGSRSPMTSPVFGIRPVTKVNCGGSVPNADWSTCRLPPSSTRCGICTPNNKANRFGSCWPICHRSKLVSCVDFHHITDAITPEEAIDLLKANEATKQQREQELLQIGLPAYTSSAGWMGYCRRLSPPAMSEVSARRISSGSR